MCKGSSAVKRSVSCHPAVPQGGRELVPRHGVNTQCKLSHSRGGSNPGSGVQCARANRAAEGKPSKPLMSPKSLPTSKVWPWVWLWVCPCHSSGLVITGQNSATPQVSQERLWLRLPREVLPPPSLEFLKTWPEKLKPWGTWCDPMVDHDLGRRLNWMSSGGPFLPPRIRWCCDLSRQCLLYCLSQWAKLQCNCISSTLPVLYDKYIPYICGMKHMPIYCHFSWLASHFPKAISTSGTEGENQEYMLSTEMEMWYLNFEKRQIHSRNRRGNTGGE